MKKSLVTVLAATAIFAAGSLMNQNVDAARTYHARYLRDNKKYHPVVTKKTDINLDYHSGTPKAKSVITNANKLPAKTKYSWNSKYETPKFKPDGNTSGWVKIVYPDGSKTYKNVEYTYHGTNHIIIPTEYTIDGLKQADDHPTEQMIKACAKGHKINKFVSESKKDDKEKIKILHLTDSQEYEINDFALRLVDEARSELGQSPWYTNGQIQSLADDIAAKYQKDKWNGMDGHYVSGLVSVSAQHGLDIGGVNSIEDLYSIPESAPKTMTDLKELTYDALVGFLFNKSEFHHAADLMSGHSDDEWNSYTQNAPFAVSFSRVDDCDSVHCINVGSNLY